MRISEGEGFNVTLKHADVYLIILILQFLMMSFVFLEAIDIQIPLVRQVIGFIYLTFIPGFLLLKLLNFDIVDNTQRLLLSLGLSISFLMVFGFALSVIFPIFDINNPFSFQYLFIPISGFVLVSSSYFYLKQRKEENEKTYSIPLNTRSISVILPFLAIVGTYLENNYSFNGVLYLLILVIIVFIWWFILDKTQTVLLALAVVMIAISLLLHTSLISNYLWGFDIQVEYYFAHGVLSDANWDFSLNQNLNSVLSIVVLAPVYSLILNLDLVWVFKIIYPLLYSFVALGLFYLFYKQSNNFIAFLGTFFFMLGFSFYMEMFQLARQSIAEIFVMLILLLIIHPIPYHKINKNSFLAAIFIFSLIISHYGIAFIYLLFFILSYFIIQLLHSIRWKQLSDIVLRKVDKTHQVTSQVNKRIRGDIIGNPFLTILFLVLFLAYYSYITHSSIIETIVHADEQIISNILGDLLNPETVQGLNVLVSDPGSPLRIITKYLHVTALFFVVIGFIMTLFPRKKMFWKTEFLVLGFLNLLFLALSMIVPYFANQLNISRVYHISLLILSPFVIIGAFSFFSLITSQIRNTNRIAKYLVLAFLTVSFIFNIGIMYELAKEKPSSLAFNDTFDFPRFNDRECYGSEWTRLGNDYPIYADEYRKLLLLDHNLNVRSISAVTEVTKISYYYIYLGTLNIEKNTILVNKMDRGTLTREYHPFFSDNTKWDDIYSNGGSSVFYAHPVLP
jgi:uncharacterized membrane protein